MEILFNLLFLLLLIGLYGEISRNLYFNPIYKRIDLWLRPLYQFLARLFPVGKTLSPHILLFSLFILLRAGHYYAYRGDFLIFKWGPALLVWKNTFFVFALHKAILATLLFYAQFIILFLLIDWLTRGFVAEPIWKLFGEMTQWVKSLFRVEGGALPFLSWGVFSLFLGVLLLPALGSFVFIPSDETTNLTFLPRIFILNLYLMMNIFKIYFFLFLIRAFISWFFPYGLTGVGELVYRLTEPLLTPLKQFNLQIGPIDLSLFLASILSLFLGEIFSSLLVRLNLLL